MKVYHLLATSLSSSSSSSCSHSRMVSAEAAVMLKWGSYAYETFRGPFERHTHVTAPVVFLLWLLYKMCFLRSSRSAGSLEASTGATAPNVVTNARKWRRRWRWKVRLIERCGCEWRELSEEVVVSRTEKVLRNHRHTGRRSRGSLSLVW